MPRTDKDYSITVMLFTWVCPGGQHLLPLIRSKTYYFSLLLFQQKLKLTQADKAIQSLLKTSPSILLLCTAVLGVNEL